MTSASASQLCAGLRQLLARYAARLLVLTPKNAVTGRMLIGAAQGLIKIRKSERVAWQLVHFLASSGHRDAAIGLARRLAGSRDSQLRALGHQVLLDAGEFPSAEAIVNDCSQSSDLDRALARFDTLVAAGRTIEAIEAWQQDPRRESEEWIERLAAGYLRIGRPELALGVLDGDSNSGSARASIIRFDANWMLGNVSDAEAALVGGPLGPTDSIEVLKRLRDTRSQSGSDARDLVPASGQANPDTLFPSLFELNELAELEARFDNQDQSELGAAAKLAMARTHYVNRHFDQANYLATQCLGTLAHWDAEKLQARVLLEQGEFGAALKQRRSRGRIRADFDEVVYFSLLQQGMFDEAFACYLSEPDYQALQAYFGLAADRAPGGQVATRMVIHQNGPGDEIMLSATYAALSAISSQLSATCDPRLQSLLARSFPSLNFIPCERYSNRSVPGFLRPGSPQRTGGELYGFLDERAGLEARNSVSVLFARSLMQLGAANAPFEPYLKPEPALLEHFSDRLGTGAVGIVWRSELSDAMRSIHYVSAAEIAGIDQPGRNYVCLQHDVTPEERSTLSMILGERIIFFDDVDLRNDFEALAAIVAVCDRVVGTGTTAVELAAAVGTETVSLQPNWIGSWRDVRDDHGDYWHRSMRMATTPDPTKPDLCVDEALAILG